MVTPEHTSHQRGIINRYYEHLDTIALQKLGEIVSDLALAEGSRNTKLWTSARAALMKLAAPDDARVANVLSTRSVTALARLVNDLNAMARAPKPAAPAEPVVGDQPVRSTSWKSSTRTTRSFARGTHWTATDPTATKPASPTSGCTAWTQPA